MKVNVISSSKNTPSIHIGDIVLTSHGEKLLVVDTIANFETFDLVNGNRNYCEDKDIFLKCFPIVEVYHGDDIEINLKKY